MDDNIILRFQFLGSEIDLTVDDIDKVMWIDLINEYEEAKKKNAAMTNNPNFEYVYKMKHHPIENDKDLMTMFERLSGQKLIYIWVWVASKPIECVVAARRLRQTQSKSNDDVGVGDASSQHVSCVDPSTLSMLDGIHLDAGFNHGCEFTWNDMELSPFPSQPDAPIEVQASKNHGKSKARAKLLFHRRSQSIKEPAATFSNAPTASVNQPSSEIIIPSNKTPLVSKKIPRTTAIRKGLLSTSQRMVYTNANYQTNVLNVDDMEIIRHGNKNKSKKTLKGKGPIGDDLDDASESDGQEDLEDVDDDDDMPVIHDDYVPYADPCWENDKDDEDDASYFSRLYKNGELYVNEEFGKIILKPWMLFLDKDHFKEVLRDYCIQCRFAIVVLKSSPTRFTCVCKDLNCGWRLHSSMLPDGKTWAIKSIQNLEHICRGLDERNPLVNVRWAADKLMDDIRANNDIPGKALNEYLWDRYGVQMATSTVHKMKNWALREINGGHDESYGYLPKYCEVVMATNEGSAAFCAWSPPTHPERPLTFSSIFISFKAAQDGLFAGCRGLVGVDGAHLKGNFGGVLLSAIALDGNNELFPFAWAIVAREDTDSWKFFAWHLKNVLKDGHRGDDWCVISDRQKGIDAALSELWPEAGRRYCCKHLVKNWKNSFPGPLMHSLFWLACSATSTFTFRKAMQRLQKTNLMALVWLSKLGDQSRWSRHKFDPKICSDENKTNFVESFNATLGVDRCRPMLTLLEGIRRVCMVRMATRRQNCESWNDSDVCPNIVKRIQKLTLDSRTCIAFMCAPGEYEIKEGKSILPVSLNNKTCVCGAWKISGLPCRHAIRAILAANMDPYKYTSTWYSVAAYKRAYGFNIKSIPDEEQWPEINMPIILPPPMKRGIGRPARNRRREADEHEKGKRSKTVQCMKCKSFGHNSRTCKGGLIEKEKNLEIAIEQHKRQTKSNSGLSATQPQQQQETQQKKKRKTSQPAAASTASTKN